MRLLKKIFNSRAIIFLRNLVGFRPVKFFITKQKNISISDTFIWRNENGFTTIVRFSDILKKFYGASNSSIEIIFFDHNRNKLKELFLDKTELSNELVIDQNFLEGYIGSGIFYIYHSFKNKLDFKEKIAVSNRCYVGYSINGQLPSFVHGNYLAGFQDLNSKKYYYNIIQKSFFKKKYQIQCDFSEFDKIELVFTNPLSHKIKFWVNKTRFNLEGGSLKIISLRKYNKPLISIFSNLMFFRPIIFTYKDESYDVYHS